MLFFQKCPWVAFCAGDFGSNFMYTFVSSFVLIYLTDTVGLEAGIIGTLMLVVSMLRGLGMSPMLGTMNAVIAETSEYTFKKDKVRLDGTMFSCSSMGIKLGSGIGTALCGWLLTLGGYVGGALSGIDHYLGKCWDCGSPVSSARFGKRIILLT